MVNLLVLAFLFLRAPHWVSTLPAAPSLNLNFHKAVTIPQIRQALGELGAGDTVIQDFGQQGGNEFLVRLHEPRSSSASSGEQIKTSLTQQFGAGKFEMRRIESVGPKVGEELR